MHKVIDEVLTKGLIGHKNYSNYKILLDRLFQGNRYETFFPYDDFIFNHLKQFDFLEVYNSRDEVVVRLLVEKVTSSKFYKDKMEQDMLLLKQQIQENIEKQKSLFMEGKVIEMQDLINKEWYMTQEYIGYMKEAV